MLTWILLFGFVGLVVYRVVTVVRRAFAPADDFEPAAMDAAALSRLDEAQRRRAASSTLDDAVFCLSSAEGSLQQASRGMWMIALGFGLDETQRNLLLASSEAMAARQSLELAALYDPAVALDVSDFDPDVTSPTEKLRRNHPLVWIGLTLGPSAIRGSVDWWLGRGRILEARREVARLSSEARTMLGSASAPSPRRVPLAQRAPMPTPAALSA